MTDLKKRRCYHIGCDSGKNCETSLGSTFIRVSPREWDSEMIEYPFVFDHKSERHMLHNGNGYGSTGFGLAVMEQG